MGPLANHPDFLPTFPAFFSSLQSLFTNPHPHPNLSKRKGLSGPLLHPSCRPGALQVLTVSDLLMSGLGFYLVMGSGCCPWW